MSTDVDLVIDETAFIATRTYDAIRNSARYGSADRELVSVFERCLMTNHVRAVIAAGLNIHDMDGRPAPEIVSPLQAALAFFEQNHNPMADRHGRDLHDRSVEFLRDFITACEDNPDSTLKIG